MDTKKTGTRGDQSPAQALTAPYLPTPNAPRTFAAQTRGKGKRERTRARLIDATAELIAKGGADSATIAEITATAGLASGTFYNHFKDRAEIIAETAISIMEQIASQINLAGRAEKDILVRFAAGTRRFLDIAYGHPTWAWAVLHSLDYLPALRPRVYVYVGSTVHIGYESGQFSHEDDFTLHILNAMLFAAVRARLTGKSGPDTGARVAEMQLRVLGVPAGRARAAANRPVAEVDFAWSDSPVSQRGQP
ncbi:MAG TPA: TetR/AcrR family transcriptional regulator [Steroidobacteraceae bacterium]|nr:TetR/AcrR family transcriptional regulator [Steroidobacteraceae bacterium]